MNNQNIRLLAVAAISAFMLAACGGGSSGAITAQQTAVAPPAPPVVTSSIPNSTISGVFNGQTDSSQPITALLQEDGSYFIVYSDAAAHAVTGAIVGTGTLTNGSFSSSNGLDLNLIASTAQTPQAVTLSASYTQQQSFNGSWSYTSGNKTATFTSVYSNPYATLPSIAALAGTYTGTIATKDLSEGNIILTIAPDGTLSGQLSCGCKINATLTPRADGMAYVATLSMVGGDHLLSDKTVAGNVYLDTVNNRLYIVGNIVGTTENTIFVGTRS